MRSEKQPKDYVLRKSLEDMQITKAIRDSHQKYTGEREGLSLTKTFSKDESTTNGDRLEPQNNRGQVY